MALRSEAVIKELSARMPELGPSIVKKVGAVLAFEISKTKGGPSKVWTVDLKNGNGKYLVTYVIQVQSLRV